MKPHDPGDHLMDYPPSVRAARRAKRNAVPDARPSTGDDSLQVICAADFHGRAVPDRQWLVANLVPRRQVTLVNGDGGVGKSLLMLQCAAAVATGTSWIGQMPQAGPVIYLSAEDEADEHHRRLIDIGRGAGFGLDELGDLHIVPLAGRDAVLGMLAKNGLIASTNLFDKLRQEVERIRPQLLVIDTLADVFAGNENDRTQARQFISLLRGLALDCDLAVVVLAHPSLSGIASGSGSSGSTGWSNSVRSRLYLDRPRGEDGIDVDPTARVLSVMKANYGPTGGEMRLRWVEGCFRPHSGESGMDRTATERGAEKAFMAALEAFDRAGRNVSANHGANYAPAVFARSADANGYGRKPLIAAMERLFAKREIEMLTDGPVSRPTKRIAKVLRPHS